MRRVEMSTIGNEIDLKERFFITRDKGDQCYEILKAQIEKVANGEALLLAFPPDQLIDASFADASIIRLGEQLVAGELGERYLLLEGLSEDSIYNIEANVQLGGIKLAFLVVEPTGDWQCIGHIEPNLLETLNIVAHHRRITAPELADQLKLAVNSASNRLKRLYDKHLIQREHEISDKGLQYIYYFFDWR